MCGIVGIKSGNVAIELYESLLSLQHRGQDSTGIACFSDKFHIKKGLGLVREVYTQKHIMELHGPVGLGQVRYATAGQITDEEMQPFRVNSPYGIAMVFNGTIYNSDELKKELIEEAYCHVNSNNDGEILLNVFAVALAKSKKDKFIDRLYDAVETVYKKAKGGYSVIAVIADKGLLAFRDPHGIRPLVWGSRENEPLGEYIFASENTMFEILNYNFVRDVGNGEAVFIDMKGDIKTKVIDQKEFRPCLFEYVYFARPDAFLNGVNVSMSRLRMGANLAKKIKRDYPNLKIDVVIPAPQTSSTAAGSCAIQLEVPYTEGLVKNQFIGRTFIMPGQEKRKRANRYKLSVIDFAVRGRNVLVVDDSIVRGNVSRHIIALLRKHGAKRVYFASASPPLRWPDLYGIDLPTRQEYVAYNKTEEEIRKSIGADVLIYQDLKDLIEAVTRKGDLKFTRPHAAYFDGKYPTKGINEKLLKEIEEKRGLDRYEENSRNEQLPI